MTSTEPRHIVVVDTETTGMDYPTHQACEVAWWDLATGEHGHFVPPLDTDWKRRADPAALKLNGYHERLADADRDFGPGSVRLHRQLRGNTLAGSNPSFDVPFLGHLFYSAECFWTDGFDTGEIRELEVERGDTRVLREPWHHRRLDLSNVAAAVLGLPLNELPGLAKVCQLLGVAAPDHTAEGDVRATGECFLKLMEATPPASPAAPGPSPEASREA